MSNYSNTLKGSLFKNDRKRSDNDPGYQGSCEMEGGKQYWVSAWVKESGPQSKNPGQKFFSLAFKPKDATPTQQAQSAAQPKAAPAAQPKPATKPAQMETEDVPF